MLKTKLKTPTYARCFPTTFDDAVIALSESKVLGDRIEESLYTELQIPVSKIIVCASYISEDYPHTFSKHYMSHGCGLIFKTEEKPDVVMPFDAKSSVLLVARKIDKDTIHQKFIFKNIEEMLSTYPTSMDAEKTYKKLLGDHPPHRNTEVIFNKNSIQVESLALFGYDPKIKDEICKRSGVTPSLYDRAADFFKPRQSIL